MKNIKGMSLAEIIMILTVIGIIAGITLPTVIDNVSNKAITTQKKATITVISEALGRMSGLNGYGSDSTNAAHSFIAGGLQKSLKIRTICGKDNLKDCGIPDGFTVSNTTAYRLNTPKNFSELYPTGLGIDTDAAGFITMNGISVVLYYNPNCTKKEKYWDEDSSVNVKDKVCINMLFDVNGKKSPNRIGKDMGYITVLYSDTPEITAPEVANYQVSSGTADTICRQLDKAHQPNVEELAAMFVNKKINELQAETGTLVSSTEAYKGYNLGINMADGTIQPTSIGLNMDTRCVLDANN